MEGQKKRHCLITLVSIRLVSFLKSGYTVNAIQRTHKVGGCDMYNVSDVAKFFLSKESMSPKKLQKMVYYAYGWTLALLNNAVDDLEFHLFSNRIEAWIHGPVIPDLYQEYKSYGWQDVPKCNAAVEQAFSSDVLDILEQVWDAYGSFSANQLEMFSHQEAPWRNAREGVPAYAASSNVISDKDMFVFFNEQANS